MNSNSLVVQCCVCMCGGGGEGRGVGFSLTVTTLEIKQQQIYIIHLFPFPSPFLLPPFLLLSPRSAASLARGPLPPVIVRTPCPPPSHRAPIRRHNRISSPRGRHRSSQLHRLSALGHWPPPPSGLCRICHAMTPAVVHPTVQTAASGPPSTLRPEPPLSRPLSIAPLCRRSPYFEPSPSRPEPRPDALPTPLEPTS